MTIKTTSTKKITICTSIIVLFFAFNNSFSQAILEVRGNNTIIANGDSTPSVTDFTDFGSVSVGNKLTRSFILKNTGSSSLVFPATNIVVSSNATQFTVTTTVILKDPITLVTNGTLNANTYTIIEISFNPTTTTIPTKTATITINLTTGTPKPYTFSVQGTATAAVTPDFTQTTLKAANTFNAPYELFYAPDNYLWLTERVGKKINRINPADGTVDLLLDLSTIVYQTGGQDGLLGMVLHPNFGKGTGEDYVYISYNYNTNGKTTYSTLPSNTANNTFDDSTRRTKLVRYTYSITGSDGSLSNPTVLIQGLSGSNDHNSGKLRIGPDGKLYYTIGDQGHNQSTTSNACKSINAQVLPTQSEIIASDYSSYEGKILRMNLDGSIPSDNPVIKGIRSHIYTYGHRNPQGLVFSKNGKLYSSEHGPKSDDEINIIQSGGNYGWPNVVGYRDDKNYAYCNWSTISGCNPTNFSEYYCPVGAASMTESSWPGTFTPPITTFYTMEDGLNFTAGYLYWPTIAPSSTRIYERFNSQIPNWDNSLVTTTLKSGEIYRTKLSPDGNSVVGESEILFPSTNRYRDIAFNPDGKTLYVITDAGSLLQFVYQPALLVCAAPVPTVASLPTITDNCSVTLTAPTATNNCSGTIEGQTTTVFPITAQGNTTVTWTYNYGNGKTVTQTQTVTINSTTWNGSTWSNGTPDATKASIIAGNLTIGSDLSTCNLTVNNNAIVTVNTGKNFNISGNVIIETGSSLTFENNANLLQTKDTNENTGNVTIKRQTSALKLFDYVLWSAPVTGQQLQLFSTSTLATRFYTYNTTTNLYNVVPTPSSTNFNTGTGYLIRMPNNHPTTATIWEGQFQGIPNNGNLSLTVDFNKYNAIGNPYPSPISANTFIDANYITEALYFWRKTNNAASTSYATYTKAGGTANAGGGSSIVPNGIIQVGQGFIYKSTSTVLTFTNAMRVTDNSNQFLKIKAPLEKSRIWLNLSKDTAPVNQMMLAYMDGATSGIDPAIDGRYINDNPTALNSLIDNEEFVIQGRSAPFENTDIVPLAFKAESDGDYSIEIDHVDGLFSGNQDIILKDNLTGTETDLKISQYAFTAAAGVDNARFSLKYQKTLGLNQQVSDENNVLVYKSKGAIHIKSSKSGIDTVKIFDISGRLIFEKTNIKANETSIESAKFGNQFLIVKITFEDQKILNKKIKN
jgi:PQQ-dependent dehydrogenase (s-GDH family)